MTADKLLTTAKHTLKFKGSRIHPPSHVHTPPHKNEYLFYLLKLNLFNLLLNINMIGSYLNAWLRCHALCCAVAQSVSVA